MFPCRACLDRTTKRGCHEWSHASAHGHCASRRRRDLLAGTLRGVSLFKDITPFSPFVWVGGVLIPLAVWLSRGSIIARNLLVVVSMIGVLFWSYLALAAVRPDWSIAAMIGVFAAVSAYCLWALKFSRRCVPSSTNTPRNRGSCEQRPTRARPRPAATPGAASRRGDRGVDHDHEHREHEHAGEHAGDVEHAFGLLDSSRARRPSRDIRRPRRPPRAKPTEVCSEENIQVSADGQ